MAEDFDLDGIQKLADDLDACWVNWFLDFLTKCEKQLNDGFRLLCCNTKKLNFFTFA
jgi:hypothetical protein